MGRKHWEKEKLLITSYFFFSHSVFKRPLLQTRKNLGLFGRGLKSLQKTILNLMKTVERVENTVGKGGIAHYEQFLLFPQSFQKICSADTKSLQFEPVYNFAMWQRVN